MKYDLKVSGNEHSNVGIKCMKDVSKVCKWCRLGIRSFGYDKRCFLFYLYLLVAILRKVHLAFEYFLYAQDNIKGILFFLFFS